MRQTTRSIAMLGATGALVTPAALALADTPEAAAPGPGHLHAGLADAPTVRAQMRGSEHDRLLRRHRRLSRAAGEHHAEARFWSNGRLRGDIRRLRRALRAREAQQTTSTASAGLQAIAACESGGDPRPIGGGGT